MKLLMFLLLVGVASAKYFTRCELATSLQAAGMDGYAGMGLADWTCLASTESKYNTHAIKMKRDGSTNFGIFQIKDRGWCSTHQFPNNNACKISCSQLLNEDISDDIECVKTIVKHGDISFWPGWQANCQAREVGQYIAGCGL